MRRSKLYRKQIEIEGYDPQQRYGVVEIPAETFIVKAYPVEMRFGDILTIIVSLAAITFVISRLTVYSMIRRGETAQDTMA